MQFVFIDVLKFVLAKIGFVTAMQQMRHRHVNTHIQDEDLGSALEVSVVFKLPDGTLMRAAPTRCHKDRTPEVSVSFKVPDGTLRRGRSDSWDLVARDSCGLLG